MRRKIRLTAIGIALFAVLFPAFIAIVWSAFGGKRATELKPGSETAGQTTKENGKHFAEDVAGDSMTESSVQIFAGELAGCGVIYKVQDEALWIVTAGHVLDKAKGSVLVYFRNGQAAECHSYDVAADADLAFLQIPANALSFGKEASNSQDEQMWSEAGYKAVTVDKPSYDVLKQGNQIIIAGFESVESGNSKYKSDISDKCSEAELLEPWIYAEDFSQYMMLARGEASRGMSGAGVFDENGNFIGILCGGNEDGELAILPLIIIEAKYAALV